MAIEHPDNQYDFEPQPNRMEFNPIGFGRELYARAAQGLGLNPFTNDPEPARIPVAESPTEGGRSLSSYLPSGEQISNGIGRFGLALEALGSGYQGQEPLYMKLRKQRAAEQDHLMQRQVQMAQMKQQKENQDFTAALAADHQLTDPKQRKLVGERLLAQGNPMGKLLMVNKEAGMLKPVVEWLSKDNPTLAATLKEQLPDMPIEQAKMWFDMLLPQYKQAQEMTAKANMVTRLKEQPDLTESEQLILQNLEAEMMKAKEEQTGRKLANKGAELGNAGKEQDNQQKAVQFPMKVATETAQLDKAQTDARVAKATVPDQIVEARNKAATSGRPQHFETQIGDNAVTLIEDGLGTGKYHVMAVGGVPVQGQKKPMVEINDTKPLTPEQAGRFSQYMAAMRDLDQLKPVLFSLDKNGNIAGVNRAAVLSAAVGGIPFTKGRDLVRFMSDAIEAKLRAETGAAAPEAEVNRIWERFGPKPTDSDAQIISKYENLSEYLKDTIAVSDPYAVHQGRAGERQPTKPFADRYAELQKKNWTDYMIFSHMKAEGYAGQ